MVDSKLEVEFLGLRYVKALPPDPLEAIIKIYEDLFQPIDRRSLDAAEVSGPGGEKVKPAVDRIREIFGIADGNKKELKKIGSDQSPKQLPPPTNAS